MKLTLIFIFSISKLNAQPYLVPYDHHLPNSRKIEVQVEFLNEFNAERETVFLLEDAFDDLFMHFNELLDFTESSNFVLIKGRKNSEELKRGVMHSGKPDYQLAYKLFNQDQVARDIEVIRKVLLGDKKVILLGYSSAAMVLQHYLSLYPQQVSRMISVNPLVFDIQKNLGFPEFNLSFPTLKFSPEQLFDFSYYSNFNRQMSSAKSASYSSLIGFLSYRDVLRGFSHKIYFENDFALQVRLFEHSIALSGFQNTSQKPNPNFELMKKWSEAIWNTYLETNFPVFGTNYDDLLHFQGKVVLIGGAFDQLIYPKSYDILAEFYSNSTLLLLKDGHAFQKTSGKEGMHQLVEAFITNDFEKKIAAYKKLSEANLIFEKYSEGDFKIPPLF
ncbi:alpha/beta fold hydrolase [Algoriphagus antarcticus]|uniref:Pimeloyl-ACP methyl ester carboxylesterase n=1 Tax=Algoriphagus antarcticus TaxID=238540 RepID=A0A3E0DQS7_9BACT|nr:alpha/beta fold hydrolase [Algoriphagus antarcticus]REG85420.1 pimeloyl-ACP methyl ester carboxylesterase [Algoriphagus antarcticus]